MLTHALLFFCAGARGLGQRGGVLVGQGLPRPAQAPGFGAPTQIYDH
jgi:hypothetical protein